MFRGAARLAIAALAAFTAACGDGTVSGGGSDLAVVSQPGDAAMPPGVDIAAPPGSDLATGPEDFALVNGHAQPATQVNQRFMADGAPWYRDISGVAPAADSATITNWMVGASPPGGWGAGGNMRIDFSIIAIDVPPGTPRIAGKPVPDYTYTPDCDTAPIPLVPGGMVEGGPLSFSSPFAAYDCPGFDQGADCHMLFVSRSEKRLYEVYHAMYNGNGFQVGCLAIWDTEKIDPNGRGQQCTSADAAGYPIAPMLFTVEELAAGKIDHAIRFILPNSMIRQRTYVSPATHGTNTTGPPSSGPYGFRMRLKANYPVGNLKPAAQVVARALQKYGMMLADGGQIALTAQSDALSTKKYADLDFDSRALSALKATDFDVIEDTPTTPVTNDCQRMQIAQ